MKTLEVLLHSAMEMLMILLTTVLGGGDCYRCQPTVHTIVAVGNVL